MKKDNYELCLYDMYVCMYIMHASIFSIYDCDFALGIYSISKENFPCDYPQLIPVYAIKRFIKSSVMYISCEKVKVKKSIIFNIHIDST